MLSSWNSGCPLLAVTFIAVAVVVVDAIVVVVAVVAAA